MARGVRGCEEPLGGLYITHGLWKLISLHPIYLSQHSGEANYWEQEDDRIAVYKERRELYAQLLAVCNSNNPDSESEEEEQVVEEYTWPR